MKVAVTSVDLASANRPRKANECFTDVRHFCAPAMLFDEFWREGELALLFGVSGAGKSLLAMQLAERIARGSGLEGLRVTATRRPVLYVDLGLTDAQFSARYTETKLGSANGHFRVPPQTVRYKFSERLARERPKEGGDVWAWVRAKVSEFGYRVVVIDSLTELKRTHDGTRETLAVMRELKRIGEELRVSILILTDADAPRSRTVSEHDLGRSRVLCGVADSVFAIGRMENGNRYIVQTRSRNAPMVWNDRNAPVCRIERLESGMLGFVFDERFKPRLDVRTRRLICRVRALHNIGATYREIAKVLDISKTRAARLYKQWTPDMEEEEEVQGSTFDVQSSSDDEAWAIAEGAEKEGTTDTENTEDAERSALLMECQDGSRGELGTLNLEPETFLHGPEPCPFMYDGSEAAERWFQHLLKLYPDRSGVLNDYAKGEAWCRPPGAIPPYDPEDPFGAMEFEVDDLGNERYVEERFESGKPRVWYGYRSDGRLQRWVKDGWGASGEPANANLFGRWAKISKGRRDRSIAARLL